MKNNKVDNLLKGLHIKDNVALILPEQFDIHIYGTIEDKEQVAKILINKGVTHMSEGKGNGYTPIDEFFGTRTYF